MLPPITICPEDLFGDAINILITESEVADRRVYRFEDSLDLLHFTIFYDALEIEVRNVHLQTKWLMELCC